LHNDYSSCIVSNILKQLLCFCDKLQSFDLKLVDSLDDILWCQILGINPLAHLVSFSLDQCHCISGDMVQDLIHQENELQVLNVSSCRFVTNQHRNQIKKLISENNYDVSSRILPFIGFSELVQPPLGEWPIEEIEEDGSDVET